MDSACQKHLYFTTELMVNSVMGYLSIKRQPIMGLTNIVNLQFLCNNILASEHPHICSLPFIIAEVLWAI